MRTTLSVSVLLSISACGPAATIDAGTDAPIIRTDAGPSNVMTFAELGAASEGLALGRDASDAPVIFVGLRDDRIVTVTPEGVVTDLTPLDAPLGMVVRETGELVVCGTAGILEVTPAGVVTELVTENQDGEPFGLTNYVTLAPDGSLVFSDSMANVVYRADADGSNVMPITTTITYPNGLAFAADGDELYIASWNTTTLYTSSFDAGTYGTPAPLLEGIMNVDGIVPASEGLVLITSVRGGLHVTSPFTAEPTTLFTTRETGGLPANAVFGDEAFGTSNLYVTSLSSDVLYVVDTELAP